MQMLGTWLVEFQAIRLGGGRCFKGGCTCLKCTNQTVKCTNKARVTSILLGWCT